MLWDKSAALQAFAWLAEVLQKSDRVLYLLK